MRKILLLIIITVLSFTINAQVKYIDRANMDLSVKPGDNFYEYANGSWLKKTVMPSTKTRWGSFDMLREESSQQLKTLLQESAKKTTRSRAEQMCGDFYTSGMDSIQLETAIAKAQWSRVELRDPQKRYNKFTLDEFSASFKTLKIPALFAASDIPKQDFIIVSTPSFFRTLDSLLTGLPLGTWKQVA